MSQLTPANAAPRGRRSRSRLLVGVLATAVTLGTLAGVAFAFWQTTDSSNPAAATATSLSAPSPSATEASATSVNISWSNPSGQPPGTEYIVQRTSPGSVHVCTTTGANQLGNTSVSDLCQDSGLSPGTTYNYSVTGVLGANWQSSPGTTSFTTMAVNITTPTTGSTFGGNWGGSISGTSSPASGTTVSSVKVSIQQGSGSCWTGIGNHWTAACPNYVPITGTVSNWTLSLPIGDLNSVNTYNITAQATDSLSISATTTSSFIYNVSPPVPSPPAVAAQHTYVNGAVTWTNGQSASLSDTVTAGAGTVNSVSYYWCTTSSCSSSGNFIGTSTVGAPWAVPWSSLPAGDGVYYVVAVATDSLSNTGTSTATQVGIDRTPPTVPTPSVNGQS